MSSVRRPLLTATAAGSLLCALWFVPTANATAEQEAGRATSHSPTAQRAAAADASGTSRASDTSSASGTQELRLADTGGVDTTPYLVGGTAFLGLGAGFVTFSLRRQRAAFG